MTPVLKATGISVRFGGVHAVVDVDLEVGEGQLVGLIGPNGAGKTTFIDAISGFVRSEGRVELDGTDLTGKAPHVRARRGLARTWQSIELFDDLSIGENLLVASHRPSVWRTVRETVSAPRSPLGRDRAGARAARPRGGRRQRCRPSCRRASASSSGSRGRSSCEPRVVCLDEPAAGLDTRESEELGVRLRGLADDGQAMLLVDHDMGLVLGICDEVVVLEFGKVIARGVPDAVRARPAGDRRLPRQRRRAGWRRRRRWRTVLATRDADRRATTRRR